MTVVVALCGALIVAGLLALGWGLVPRPRREPGERRSWAMWPAQVRADQVVAAVFGGLLALVLTRWPVAGVVGAAGAWQAVAALRRPRDDTAQRAEAVALWAEILRDGLGTSMEIETVLRTTAPIAPQLIRADVEAATARLAYMPYDDVLDELADKLDASSGDMVVSALRLAGRSGGRQVRDVLDSVAKAAYSDADTLRRVEVARERPRSSARLVVGIVVGTVAISAVAFRRWLEPYASPSGQIALAIIALWCWAAMWWMSRMSQVEMPARFSARREVLP
jgi:Flp pilus assembly protein TadB